MSAYISQFELSETRPNGSTHCRIFSVDYVKGKLQGEIGTVSGEEFTKIESFRCDILPGLEGDLLSLSQAVLISALQSSVEASL